MRHGRTRDLGDTPWVTIAAVVGVIAVVIIALVFFLGGGLGQTSGVKSSGSSSAAPQTTMLKNQGVASITVKETTAPTVPVSGVWVLIDYKGGFKGSYGMDSDLQQVEDSGARIYEVVNATGLVKVTLEKKDSSTKWALTAGIYKDGKLLKSGSTSESYGKMSISADVGGSAVQTSSATVGTVTSTTAATAKPTSVVATKITTKSS